MIDYYQIRNYAPKLAACEILILVRRVREDNARIVRSIGKWPSFDAMRLLTDAYVHNNQIIDILMESIR